MDKSNTKSKKEWKPQIWFKNYFFHMKEEDGYMTLLACMLFLVVSALLLICLDGSLVYQAKARTGMAQSGLTEHLLGNYNVPLAKRYHLYFLDPRMNQQVLEEKGEEYYEELFSESSGPGLFSSPVWRMKTESLKIEPYGTMQEKEFQFFITQINDCMKYDLTKDLLMKVLGDAVQETEKQSAQLEETVTNLNRNEPVDKGSQDASDHTLTPSEVAQGEQAGSEVQENNPLKKIRSILEYGVLGIVADESELSERKLTPSLLPFRNQKENNIALTMDVLKSLDNISELIKNQGLDQLTEKLKNQGTLNLYIQKYFNCFGKKPEIEGTELLYEMEYILGGQYSDKENLEYVINKLVFLRFALNASYAFSNEELSREALALAAVLTGIAGTPEFMKPVQYLILAAVNLIESIMDVEALLSGYRVPMMKSDMEWHTSVSGSAKGDRGSLDKGLDYQTYILILLTLQVNQDRKCYRMQNLMQINIQKEEPEFQIQECRAGIEVETAVKTAPMFYLKDYVLKDKEKVTY